MYDILCNDLFVKVYAKVMHDLLTCNILFQLGVKTIFDEKRSEINMFTKNDNLYGSNAIHDISSKVDDEKGSPKIDAYSSKLISTNLLLTTHTSQLC